MTRSSGRSGSTLPSSRAECRSVPGRSATAHSKYDLLVAVVVSRKRSVGLLNAAEAPALGQRVLVGEEAVVGVEPHLVPPLHGPGQDRASEPAGLERREGLIEENPDVSALAGTRSFKRGRDTHRLSGNKESSGVVLPGGLVEVDGQKPAGLVR